ncbi:MAG: ATP-binding protein [Candidatus Binatia bacterium]
MKLRLRAKYSLVILFLVITFVIFFAALVLLQFRSTMLDVTSLTSKRMQINLLNQLERRAELMGLFLAENLINPVYHYDLEGIYDLTKATRQQEDVIYVYVYDTSGQIIHDGTKDLPLLDKVLDDDISKKAVAARRLIIQTTRDSLDVATPIRIGHELLGGVRVGFSLKGVNTEIQRMQTELGIIGGSGTEQAVRSIATAAIGLSALGIILAIFVARGLSQPIRLLSTLSARVGRGEYDVEIPIKRSDELGELATSFKKMTADLKTSAGQIQRQLQRITALREIDQAVTSTLDLQTVLDVLLEKIDLFLPYAVATVRLFNKESGLLEPVACRNIDEKEWKAERLEARCGLFTGVFENKVPMIADNVQSDPRVQDPEFFRKNGLVSYLGVPLIAKGEVLGVLSFYTKAEHQFSHDEVSFLQTIGGEAGMAVLNAQLFEEVKTSKSELEKALKVKSDFLGTMSHELRTPLHVIMSNTTLLADGLCGDLNEQQQQRLNAIERNSKDLLRLVQGILDITRLEQRRMPIHLEEISVCEILTEVQSEFDDLSLKKEIAIEVDKNGLPPTLSDRMKLKEILHNLVSNAVKFTRDGKVKVKARHLSKGDRVEFVVQDTGIGIKQEDLPYIFDVFHQVDSSSQREFGGTGLGLHIVKRLVELLQGEIRVESEFGKGSTFYVTLPREFSPSQPA